MHTYIHTHGKNLGDGEGGAPLLLENVQADAAIAVDVWVEDLRPETNLPEKVTISLGETHISALVSYLPLHFCQ